MNIPTYKAAWEGNRTPAGQVKLIDFLNKEVHIFIDESGNKSSCGVEAPFDEVELFAAIGATDLDGNEIFEGDILEFYNDDGKVLCTEEVPTGMRSHTIHNDPYNYYDEDESNISMSEYLYFICDGKPNARVIGHVTDIYSNDSAH